MWADAALSDFVEKIVMNLKVKKWLRWLNKHRKTSYILAGNRMYRSSCVNVYRMVKRHKAFCLLFLALVLFFKIVLLRSPLQSLLNTSASPSPTRSWEELVETTIRCRVYRVGCFSNEEGNMILDKQEKINRNTSFKQCSYACSLINLTYVMFAKNRWCYCGKSIRESLVGKERKLLPGSYSSCLNTTSIFVNRISKCEENDYKKILAESLLGCISPLPREDKDNVKIEGIYTPVTCLMTCEKREFLIAALLNSEACFCINPTLESGYPTKRDCEFGTEDYVIALRTNVEDKRCPAKKFLTVTKNASVLIGLISFPGSGNSWIRHLLEVSTGIYTGSIYKDEGMYTTGFLGEILPWNSNRTIVVKSNVPELKEALYFHRAILLIRDPFDAMLAEFNRLHGGQTGFASNATFKSKEWSDFVQNKITKWSRTVYTYLYVRYPLHVVYYEDVVEDTMEEVKKMIKFIGRNVESLEQRLLCTLGDLIGELKREKRESDRYENWMIEIVNRQIGNVRKTLKTEASEVKILPDYERRMKP